MSKISPSDMRHMTRYNHIKELFHYIFDAAAPEYNKFIAKLKKRK